MAEEGCRVAYLKRKRRAMAPTRGDIGRAPNLVGRDFHADAPNELWLTDITEFKLPGEEKAYLSPVIDCYDGLVVAWRIGEAPERGARQRPGGTGRSSQASAQSAHSD